LDVDFLLLTTIQLFTFSNFNPAPMKKITFLLNLFIFCFAFIFSSPTFAQSSLCPWAKKSGGTEEEWASAMATDQAGNVYTLGNFYSSSIVLGSTTLTNQPQTFFNYAAEMFLVKYDACGNFKWARKAGGNNEMRAKGIATDLNGNVFVTGYF
jgi:hypothetical protein